MKKIMVFGLISVLLIGCSSFNKLTSPSTPNTPIINAGIEFITVKAIQSASNPADAAAKAKAIITSMQGLLTSGLLLNLTTLDSDVKAALAKQNLTPADAILFDAVRQAAYNDLAERMPAVTATLAPADITAAQTILNDVLFGIQISGY